MKIWLWLFHCHFLCTENDFGQDSSLTFLLPDLHYKYPLPHVLRMLVLIVIFYVRRMISGKIVP
ncbi:hypothetical protein [Bacillus phage Hyb1phi3Ts-SPbeta]|nr:hypothetical protein [Bacillus phage Hyb1phi3Ts-SPbeta]